jgi:hypothetical protein
MKATNNRLKASNADVRIFTKDTYLQLTNFHKTEKVPLKQVTSEQAPDLKYNVRVQEGFDYQFTSLKECFSFIRTIKKQRYLEIPNWKRIEVNVISIFTIRVPKDNQEVYILGEGLNKYKVQYMVEEGTHQYSYYVNDCSEAVYKVSPVGFKSKTIWTWDPLNK